MYNFKKALSLCLAQLTLLGTLAACAGDEPQQKTDTTADTTTAEVQDTTTDTEDARKSAQDNIPADLSLDGATVGWICHGETAAKFSVDGGGEESGDSVYSAVYNRTRSVEERLDLTFDITCNLDSWKDYGTLIETNVLAGDDSWDLVYIRSNSAIQMSRDYLFKPLQDLEYLELDQPWWWTDAIREMSLDGETVRYLMGDLILDNLLNGMRIVFFNKRIMEDIGEDVDAFYDTVLNREWTMDEMSRLTTLAYNDTNGNGEMDVEDRFGCYIGEKYMLYGMSYAHNVRRQSRDENNYVYADYDLDRGQQSLESILKFVYDTKGTWYGITNDTTISDCFVSGNALFYYGVLEWAFSEEFRSMDDEYGILPSPLLDLEQEEYQGLITNNGMYATVPTTSDQEKIGAVLEALCSESYRSVMAPFYEVALKTRYSSDSKTSQCIDIIRDTAYKSILTEYDVGNCGELEFKLILENSNELSSTYASTVKRSNAVLANIYKKFEQQKETN